MSGVNRRTDRRILKIFLSGFRIQSEIFTDFRILQFQRIADSSIFWARILDFPCIENFFAWISDSGRFRAKMAGRIWLINYNGSADLHTPIHAPLPLFLVESHVLASDEYEYCLISYRVGAWHHRIFPDFLNS